MLNKDAIIKVLESHSMKAKVFGAVTTLIPDTEFSELAHEILLLVQPNSDMALPLQQADVNGSLELLALLLKREQEAAKTEQSDIKAGEHYANQTSIEDVVRLIRDYIASDR